MGGAIPAEAVGTDTTEVVEITEPDQLDPETGVLTRAEAKRRRAAE
ncbi:hypothetical protein [Streptomyces tuirus]